jgi:thiamine-phosphate pyrophosphorylase
MLLMKGFYFITDSALSKKGNIDDVQRAIDAGVRVIQYRNKTGTTAEMVREAAKIREICRDTVFLIDDRVDVALAVNADGVHVGAGDMPFLEARKLVGGRRIVGVTVHNSAEAAEAEMMGADYVGASPVFATGTKSDAGEPGGVELIKKIRNAVQIPIVAIGGITLENAAQVVEAGANALCAISAVVTKDNVGAEIMKFQKLFDNI